ncbi:MAG: lysophospholipid acyltransferase family protein [Tepidiformaceae bacterium]
MRRNGRQPARWPRTRPVRWLRRAIMALVVVPLFRIAYGIEVRGRANVLAPGPPCLMVSNHNMGLDWGILAVAFPARVRQRLMVAAGSDEIFGNRFRGFAARVIGNAFPFPKEGARIRHGLESAQTLLDEGWHVLVLPEGERKSHVPMRPFKPGIGWLVARTGAEVVPIRIDVLKPGIFDGGGWRRPRGRVCVSFGPRLQPDTSKKYDEIAGALEEAVREA